MKPYENQSSQNKLSKNEFVDEQNENKIVQSNALINNSIPIHKLFENSNLQVLPSSSYSILPEPIEYSIIENLDEHSLNKLKRKRTFSNSNISCDALLSSVCLKENAASPPNWYEANLMFIKDMLAKLNTNVLSTSSNMKINNPKFLLNDSKQELKILCETVKEKLENKAYGCIDDLNIDLNIIKETYSINEIKNSAPISIQAESTQISCFKFDDDTQKLESIKLENEDDFNATATNKRIRLLKMDLTEKSLETTKSIMQPDT